ncbi:hypothetical protein DBV15_12497 [Temnothorax longispinosus]|uniref:DDE Tnp4 domain-containing protein n=1 Tax=Temnothorax longispinosus TaxID=300112 RepID=A0A4S2KT48_9HYME|nr:hypothetical protein DBV15_12497 [Temnothorax longispinosus]
MVVEKTTTKNTTSKISSTLGAYSNLVAELRNDVELFFNYHRMTPNQFDTLLHKIEPQISKLYLTREPLPPGLRLFLTLRYIAAGDKKIEVEIYKLDNGVKKMNFSDYETLIQTQPGIQRKWPKKFGKFIKIILWRKAVSNGSGINYQNTKRTVWILTKLDNVIKWPEGQHVAYVSHQFYSKRDIPNVIGAIDCTHIRIEKPNVENARDYCNRKKYFSVNLQAVVDADMKFTNVYCGQPGSLHDARVLRKSELYNSANEHREIMFPDKKFIIGDSLCISIITVACSSFPLSNTDL